MISLGAGAPSAAYFPFQAVHVDIVNPPGFSNAPDESQSVLHMAKYDFEPDVSEYSKLVPSCPELLYQKI